MALPLSFGKAQASAVANTAEATFALANFNFDFSLYKVEAPVEYAGVGTSLSPFRKKEAESGRAHVTARKLGALFESILPETPELIRVYGIRASEISESPAFGLLKSHHYGFFASRVGADATSIWASATSGPSTIRIHLLACMLARIWDGSEATSIWVEIVNERKQQMIHAVGASHAAAVSMIAQQEISRAQLAEWDASARAWLRTADAAMKRQQKQLNLIVSNVEAAVNTRPRLYDSVMDAWVNALKTMECLVQGMPQQMTTGEILLGLSAWHIYPDLVVVDAAVTNISQKDALVRQGGILTIGLYSSEPRQEAGVYWSLPLAHLRYYGDAVLTSRSISKDGSRLTLDELMVASLGAVIATWELPTIDDGIRWIIQLSNSVSLNIVTEAKDQSDINSIQESWLTRLASVGQIYLDSRDIERQRYVQLISLGKRCSGIFLGQSPKPFFGFSDFEVYFSLLEHTEDQIEALRWAAEEVSMSNSQSVIRYRYQYPDMKYGKHSKKVFEYAVATKAPARKDSPIMNETIGSEEHRNYLYGRWIYSGTVGSDEFCPDFSGRRTNEFGKAYKDQLEKAFRVQGEQLETIGGSHKRRSGLPWRWNKSKVSIPNLPEAEQSETSSSTAASYEKRGSSQMRVFDEFESTMTLPQYTSLFNEEERSVIMSESHMRKQWLLKAGEKALPLEERPIKEDLESDSVFIAAFRSEQEIWERYQRVIGQNSNTALYCKASSGYDLQQLKKNLPKVGLERLHKVIASESRPNPWFLKAVTGALQILSLPYLRALRALASTAKLYKLLPGATISVKTLHCKISEAAWVPRSDQALTRLDGSNDDTYKALRRLRPYDFDRWDAFACIAMHETGFFNLEPRTLTSVMALSTADSLFVAAPLLCDPSENPRGYEVRRIMGNIGRAGVAILVPPVSPRIKTSDIDKWTLINHGEFHGTPRDFFKSTSLHLSFTGSNLPMDVGYSGKWDVEAYVLESLVSVHEGGEWVADLNVLNAFQQRFFQRLRPCDHLTNLPSEQSLISIKNWTEFLDRPQRCGVVQAHGNWQARLAAMTISIMQEHSTIVVSDKFCWKCLFGIVSKSQRETPFTIIY